ncbi:MAG TPA: hypothetical protein VKB26_08445 [Candidatus Acidoferrales bacterium]|nr:hypothetical protein [Candidatus Acidoferrales bacterium]
MLFDQTHRKWLTATVIILIVATAVYIPYALSSPQGPRGGSATGLAFGIAAFALMIFAGLLGARKKVPVWRVGRAQTWMRGHLWLGLISLPLVLFHAGFHKRGTLTFVLMILTFLVVASGIFGAILQAYIPRRMTIEVPMETIYEQIDHVRSQLREEADQLATAACGTIEGVRAPAASEIAASGQTASAVEIGVEVSEESRAQLREFYVRRMRPFLNTPAERRSSPLADAPRAAGLFEELRLLLPPELHETLKDFESICEEERQLVRQAHLHRILHAWLLVHVPLSYGLLVLVAVHAVMALRF